MFFKSFDSRLTVLPAAYATHWDKLKISLPISCKQKFEIKKFYICSVKNVQEISFKMESQDINVENPGLFDGTIIPNTVSTEVANKESDDEDTDDVISIHMDLIKPLSQLKSLVENIVGAKLNDYSFWLQDSQEVRSSVVLTSYHFFTVQFIFSWHPTRIWLINVFRVKV